MNTTNTAIPNKYEYLERDYEYYLKMSFMGLMISIGSLGNLLVFFALMFNQTNPGNYFFLNLAVVDISISSISMPIILFHIRRDSVLLMHNESSPLCDFSAHMDAIIFPVSWYSLAFTAVNLNCKITEPAFYKTFFKKQNILIIICLIWIWIFILNIFNMVGWIIPSNLKNDDNSTDNTEKGYYEFYDRYRPPVVYDKTSHICFLGISNQEGRTFGTGFFSMTIPLFTIIFAYANMIVVVVRSRRTVTASFGYELSKRRLQDEAKVFRMAVTMVIIFLICWVPAIMFDYLAQDQRTRDSPVRLVLNWLALSYSVVKVFIYAAFSRKIRNGYKQTLHHLIAFPLYGRNTCVRLRQKQRRIASNNNRVTSNYNMKKFNAPMSGKVLESTISFHVVTPSSSFQNSTSDSEYKRDNSTNFDSVIQVDIHKPLE